MSLGLHGSGWTPTFRRAAREPIRQRAPKGEKEFRMNRPAFLLLVTVSLAGIIPQAPAEEANAIDPRFESHWGGDAEAEARSIRDVGQVIGSYVADQAAIHRQWRAELAELQAKKDRGEALSESETRHHAVLVGLMRDLPEQEN